MEIKDCLAPDDVLVDVRAPDKARLLEDLSSRGAAALGIDAALVAGAILRREELGSTGVGGGVAIPHARIQEVRKPYGIVARLKKPLAFDAIDGFPVDILFFLALPTAPQGEALNTLAAVSRRLRNAQVLGSIRQASEADGIYEALVAGRNPPTGENGPDEFLTPSLFDPPCPLAPRLTPQPLTGLAEVAELVLIKLGKGAPALVFAQPRAPYRERGAQEIQPLHAHGAMAPTE